MNGASREGWKEGVEGEEMRKKVVSVRETIVRTIVGWSHIVCGSSSIFS